jgi:hypothetical protein
MRISNTLLFAFLAFYSVLARSEPMDVCVSVFEKAEQEQAAISSFASARGVIGTGRLYFHAAPDKRCSLKDVFVIPGDRLEAYADYGEFTSVIYWKSTTGAGTAGWVLSSRLTDTGAANASGMASR